MAIRNYMEQAVKSEVARQRTSREGPAAPCWCAQCEADITCLSLTTLPPRYCMDFSYALTGEKVVSGVVRAAVRRAMVKVGTRPKHRPGAPEYYPRRLRIINFPLEEGRALVHSAIVDSGVTCACPQCEADALAFALNRFPPLYGVEYDGTLRLPPTQLEFMRHDLELVLRQAARTIGSRPHH